MADYDKLIKALRICGAPVSCKDCPHYADEDPNCFIRLKIEAADAIEELQKLTDAQLYIIKQYQVYLTKQHWIPVTERLPNENVAVLTWGESQAVVLIDWLHNGEWAVRDGVTHWMPLPQPPTDCKQLVTDSNQVQEEEK